MVALTLAALAGGWAMTRTTARLMAIAIRSAREFSPYGGYSRNCDRSRLDQQHRRSLGFMQRRRRAITDGAGKMEVVESGSVPRGRSLGGHYSYCFIIGNFFSIGIVLGQRRNS